MAVKIRLQRIGKRNRPLFRIVVIEESKKLSGKSVDVLGIYDPIKKDIKLDVDKYEKWLKVGAQVSDTVSSLYKKILKKQKIEKEIISAISSSSTKE